MYKYKAKENIHSINEGLTHLHEIQPYEKREIFADFFFNGNINGGRSFITSTGDFRIVIFK